MNFEVNSSEYTQWSILKSTRQKNWLLTPSSTKRVTFQFEIQKITGEKRIVVIPVRKTRFELTIVKAANKHKGLPSNKQSGISSFIYTPEEFPEDTAI